MKKHLFLIGPSGCGKSTILKKFLGSKISYAGGFITERKMNEYGKPEGFDLLPAAAASGIPGFTGKRFLDFNGDKVVTDNEVFRTFGVQLLQEAQMYPFAVLDEFGGFELIIPQFREALLEILNSELPCIGVLKAAPDAARLRRSLGLGERYTAYRDALEAALERDEDTMLLHTAGQDDRKAMELVRSWCDEYAT